MAYKYSVISFMPDIPAGETVNIGIELHDMDTKVLYRKYTKNVDELSRRYGYSPILPILFTGLNQPPEIESDKNYLLKKHEEDKGVYNRIFYREPYGGILTDDGTYSKVENHLENLYDTFIIIDREKKEMR
ncbi:MAG: hypothetical protein V3V41_10705 [Candidatus Heimdallarchaeota archaeon]